MPQGQVSSHGKCPPGPHAPGNVGVEHKHVKLSAPLEIHLWIMSNAMVYQRGLLWITNCPGLATAIHAKYSPGRSVQVLMAHFLHTYACLHKKIISNIHRKPPFSRLFQSRMTVFRNAVLRTHGCFKVTNEFPAGLA